MWDRGHEARRAPRPKPTLIVIVVFIKTPQHGAAWGKKNGLLQTACFGDSRNRYREKGTRGDGDGSPRYITPSPTSPPPPPVPPSPGTRQKSYDFFFHLRSKTVLKWSYMTRTRADPTVRSTLALAPLNSAAFPSSLMIFLRQSDAPW